MAIALVGPELEESLGLRYLAASVARAGHHSAASLASSSAFAFATLASVRSAFFVIR